MSCRWLATLGAPTASSAGRASSTPATKAYPSSDNPCCPGQARHEVLPPPLQARCRWQPLPTQPSPEQPSCASRTARGADNSPNSRSPGRPPPGRRTTRTPPPRSSANDRPPDAPQARPPPLPRADRPRTTPTPATCEVPLKRASRRLTSVSCARRRSPLVVLDSSGYVRPPSFAALLASSERNRRLGPSQQLASDQDRCGNADAGSRLDRANFAWRSISFRATKHTGSL
jgi:hypothetical protein